MSLNEKQINKTARRFFLGAMSEDERAAFEAAFVADQSMFDHVSVAEDELVEEYVRGHLSSGERETFEKNYLALPKNRERVEFTRAMIDKFVVERAANVVVENKPSILTSLAAFFAGNRLAVGSVFALLITITVGLILLSREKPPEVARVDQPVITATPTQTPVVANSPIGNTNESDNITENVNSRPKTAPTPTPQPEKNNNKSVEPSVRTPVLALFAGTLRSGGRMPELALDKDTANARLQLNLESRDYTSYIAEVVDADGNVVSRSAKMRARGTKIEFNLPSSKLKPGEYQVRLSGQNTGKELESVADYAFRVKHN